ncbi:MAG: acetate--CoA ligase family protein [Thermoplasmata archaeon]|nr:acetate--CoA ligase family protein [Thermoplasmata archaeon]
MTDKKVIEEIEVKEMLKKYGINVPDGILVRDLPEKIDLPYPLVLKVSDPNILHKSDVGGVILNIKNYDELALKFKEMKGRFPKSNFLIESMEKPGVEIIIGLIQDKTFGLSIMFGLGGIFTELYKDVSFRLVPIEEYDAKEMVEEIKAKKLFEGFRNIKADKNKVIDLLMKVSSFGMDHYNSIDQLDLNPVIVREDKAVVVDAKLIMK